MQFKHPELLYALLLLLIPIFIHLFQLRKFQKVAFTNVSFLKKVSIETRKSSQLKKWLTLLTRMLVFACIIVAFTQPFSASKSALKTNKETVIYIDNSFSMQLKGSEGALLERGLQQLYSQSITSKNLSWLTNDFSKKNVSHQDFKNDILSVNYSQKQLTPKEVLLKSNQLFSKNNPTSEKRLIFISDFQTKEAFPEIPEDIIIDAVQLKNTETSNISIDTAYISSKDISSIKLTVQLSAQGYVLEVVPVSLYNKNKLIAKTAIDFTDESDEIHSKSIVFEIKNNEEFKGRIEINEPNLLFDNTLFFNINTPKKIKALSINKGTSSFLNRIYNVIEFDFIQQNLESLNYSDFSKQNFIILNEVDDIPESLVIAIKSFSDNGGTVLIIPSNNASIDQYNSLLSKLQLGAFSTLNNQEKKITQIVFDHPLFSDVFEKRVVNFQYPKVNSYYAINTNQPAVLKFEDAQPFIIQNANNFTFTAAINNINSNFQSSPLIVPTLYNMAKQSLPLPKLYYEIGKQNQYSIPVSLAQDEILKITDSSFSYIPLQQTKANQVNITTIDNPSEAGTFVIEKDKNPIEKVSYNYNRTESLLTYSNPENWKNATVHTSVDELFSSIAQDNSIHSYWKWFAIFALLFLVLEMIILKFYK
tara:strand:- start:1472 stop:3409 length:1938 start_codon:yes stop_codon:yes gene_type:complete